MSLSSGRLEVGDRGCAMDERRGVAMPCVVVLVPHPEGLSAFVRFDLDSPDSHYVEHVVLHDFYFEAEAS